ncbi:MAG: glycoside hydrolase family 2 protein [Novosphingobium sp.]|nr:glycoside hydrolase family 2 protein [Novosphingobium sp.]
MSDGKFLASRREAMVIAAGAATVALAPTAYAAISPKTLSTGGRDQPFDDGWRFLRGPAPGGETIAFADEGWRKVDLPHDWSVEDLPGSPSPTHIGPFTKSAVGGNATGFTEGGEGWYRKHFRVEGIPPDARVEVSFDGVYLDCDVWLNGQRLGGNVHGYIPFAFDLTPHLDRAGDNVLAVNVRNEGKNTRWYAGSGIYRQVKLDVLPGGARIARWGVGAWTKKLDASGAAIEIATDIEGADPHLTLVTRLRDDKGVVVAEASAPAATTTTQQLNVRAPRLWSPKSPSLHVLETELRRGDTVVDRVTQPFGIRIVTFDPQRGMSINGTATKLRGGCIHHDNGLLGACAFADADERRIRLLQARGFNAIRSSHNPTSRSLREVCDRLGMLVIEEAFDVWHSAKEPQDFSVQFHDHWEEVIRAMVLGARNSPSVIMWSIGNEIPYRATPEGVEWCWKLANAVKRLDPTRPVTAGINGVLGEPVVAGEGTARPGRAGKVDNASTVFLDVPGYNYRLDDIEAEHVEHPERVVYASETFARELFEYAALSDRAPYFLGEFLWTAMDYLGEAGVGATAPLKKGGLPYYFAGFPWVNAWCGDIDLIGQQKASSLARDVAWGLSPLEMTVHRPLPEDSTEFVSNWGWPDELASWNWDEHLGKSLGVRLYTTGDRVELRLNGAVVGNAVLKPGERKAEISVPYAAGTLEAVAFRGARELARRKLQTTGAAAALRTKAERATGRSDRQALHYVLIDTVDAQGRVLPDDKRKLRVKITGPAELVAFGSANPLAVGSLKAPEAESFRGRALAILRSTGQAGPVRIEASADGVHGGAANLKLV